MHPDRQVKGQEQAPVHRQQQARLGNVRLRRRLRRRLTASDGKPLIRYREADYATVTSESELAVLEQELQANPEGISLEDLEKRAQLKRPNDFFLLPQRRPGSHEESGSHGVTGG